jgi:hypothetical protein
MLPARRWERKLSEIQMIFNVASMTVGGLYLTTHSVAVTLIGTAAGAAVTGWTTWLENNQTRTMAGSGKPGMRKAKTVGAADDVTGGAHGRAVTPYPDEPRAN